MKIAVFGDSFAAPIELWQKDVVLKSWVEHLQEKYDITNYAVSGSSLYFSLKQFITVQHLYEKIIFVATMPGRLYVNQHSSFKEHQIKHIGSLAMAEFLYKEHKDSNDPLSIELAKVTQAAIQYYTYIQRNDYDKLTHNLMVDHIRSIRPDMIFVQSFRDSYRYDLHNPSLYDITEIEHKHWKLPRAFGSTDDTRRCHMCKENNLILAGLAERWLQGEPVNININDFVVPQDDKSYYNIT